MATFFEHFTPKEVAKISGLGRRVHLPEGWSPIWKDTPADKAYIILDGTVSVERNGDHLRDMRPGNFFGELAMLAKVPRTATVTTMPGMLAAKTSVPVLGVPVASRHLQGVDSLHSIVQMPKGIPVATFAIGEAGAANAALVRLVADAVRQARV